MTYDDRTLHRVMTNLGQQPEFVPAPKRKRRDNEESRSQQSLITWWDAVGCKHWNLPHFLLFAVGNGGKRSAITGAIMKREGVRAGTSDLILFVARGKYHALALEMKKPAGKPTMEQDRFIVEAQRQGYAAGCAYSTQDAVRFIECYLRGEEFF